MTSNPIHRIVAAVMDPTAAAVPAAIKAAQRALALHAELVLFHSIDVPLYADV